MFLNFLVCQDCPNRVKFCNACSLNRGPGDVWIMQSWYTAYEWFEWTTRIDVGRNHIRKFGRHWWLHITFIHAFQELPLAICFEVFWRQDGPSAAASDVANRWWVCKDSKVIAIQGCAATHPTHFFWENATVDTALHFFCALVCLRYAISNINSNE